MSCEYVQVIFLFVHVIVNMNKLFLSNEAISIAVRDLFYHIFRCKVSFDKNYSFNHLSNV